MNNVYKVAVLKLHEHFTPHIDVTYGLCVSYRENRLINTLQVQYRNIVVESEMIRDQVIKKCT